jgi:hypothetical protein
MSLKSLDLTGLELAQFQINLQIFLLGSGSKWVTLLIQIHYDIPQKENNMIFSVHDNFRC